MSFSVRRVENPTIYVRRNKPDILGLSNAWDNIAGVKDALNRLEDNINAAGAWQKPFKKDKNGPVLKEISSERQHLGKVTRFQLLDERPNYKSEPKYSASTVEIKSGRKHAGLSKTVPVPDISSINPVSSWQSGQGVASARDGYSPSRYTHDGSRSGKTFHDEMPSFFKTTTVNPVILNDTSVDSNHNKESSFANTTGNSSVNSQQFSLSSSPSFHGKAVLAKNEAARQKIKEKVQKQKEMLSKQNGEIIDLSGDRKLHDSKDQVTVSVDTVERIETSHVPLKRKVGTTMSSGPTYRGFSAVSQKTTKNERNQKVSQNTAKTSKEIKPLPKPHPKPGIKQKKGKMNRIIGTKCPKEVISTTSWRDGQAAVKKILNAKKGKPSKVAVKAPQKTDTTYSVTSPTQDEFSEGRLSDEDEKPKEYKSKYEKVEAEKDIPKHDGAVNVSEIKSDESDVEDKESLNVLSVEAQSMLADLAKDSSESENELREEEKPKPSGQNKKPHKTRRPRVNQKLVAEEKCPKMKSRHYDQSEVQKYMAQQIAERKKKMKEEKLHKKKQEEEKQRRLKDLYERQKKSFALPKKEKRLGQTFSCGDVHIPGHQSYRAENQEYDKVDHRTSPNESDKENREIVDLDDLSGSEELSSDHRTNETTQDDETSSRESVFVGKIPHEKPPSRGHSGTKINPPSDYVVQPASSSPLDERAKRLTALKATALALQNRLQSQALRLGGVNEEAVSQPVPRVEVQDKEKETGFHGALPGVTNVRKQADENEKQLTRVKAATKIQAAYRGHTVRKRTQWNSDKDQSDEYSVQSSPPDGHRDVMSTDDDDEEKDLDSVEFKPLRPSYTADPLDERMQLDFTPEKRRFLHTDIPILPPSHYSVPSVQLEARGDRFSVMNIFTRRHPTVAIEGILDDQPGSETASLLEVGGTSRKTEQDIEYADDFTDEEISTASVLTEGELGKNSAAESRVETYSECFESDGEEDLKEKDKTMEEDFGETSSGKIQPKFPQSAPVDDVMRPEDKDSDIVPVMTSTMHPEYQPDPSVSPSDDSDPMQRLPEHHSSYSASISNDSGLIQRPVFVRPVNLVGGNRLSPDSLQRKLTAEINLLENVEDSVRQVNDIEKTRAVSLAQQETVSLAQILKAKQQSHEQEMLSLRLKAKDEAIQAAEDLEKTRQAAAVAAASAAEKLAEVQNEVMKANAENARKYVEEATKMTSGVLSNTSQQLAEFCKNITNTTSAAVQDLHKMDRPTAILVERATSFSEDHVTPSENGSKSDGHTRSSETSVTSPSVTPARQHEAYSSDGFESYRSPTAGNDESDIKTEPTLSVESIVEDLPDKSVSDDDTTVNEDSANDSHSLLTKQSKPSDKLHQSDSPLDYSSAFEDSSHIPTDDDIDFHLLLPSKEHQQKSIKRIKDDSFDEVKGKVKMPRSPFESDDSFGKFTVDMIQQYMREEEVRTRHQAAILRLREKSLKEKTKAELQWLDQLKKRSRDKGSDDVMPSIKKRERGILLKLQAEKEEIKCLKAANRAASFQRRFMIHQQQEIHRLHQATMNIRERIQGDVSKKSSQRSSHEPSQNLPKTSSPLNKSTSNTQFSPSDTLSKAKKSPKASVISSASPTAKSVSEDINEGPGTSHVSPATSGSPFPSYSTPKTEASKAPEASQISGPAHSAAAETSTILDMLSLVDVGATELPNQNGDRLLKIHKMLLERQKKLVKDESEVNSMLQKVTEMINNQRNHVSSGGSHGNRTPESARTPATVSDVFRTKKSDDFKSSKSHSEVSIPEEVSSAEKTNSEEIKEVSDKDASEYDNCTFESDSSPSRPPTTLQVSSAHVSQVQVDEEPSSLTETSDHSDYEEKIKKLKEQIQREKMKADELEKKKQKMKRSVMKKEVLKLEKELKNTREDIHRKRAEIKMAAVSSPTPPTLSSGKPTKISPVTPKKESSFSKQEDSSSKESAQETSYTFPSGKDFSESSVNEVEESLVEELDGPSIITTMKVVSKEDSPVSHQNGVSDVPEDISEHSDSDSAASKPDETRVGESERNLSSKVSDIPEIPEELHTQPQSSPDQSESIAEDLENFREKTPEISGEELKRSYTDRQSSTSIPEESLRIVEDSQDLRDKTETTDEVLEPSYTEPRSDTSIPEGSPSIAEDSPGSRKRTETPDEILQHSYTEPQSGMSIPEESPTVVDRSRATRKERPGFPDEALEHTNTKSGSDATVSDETSTDHEKPNDISEEISKKKSDSIFPEPNEQEDHEIRSLMSDFSEISENLPSAKEEEEHFSAESNAASERIRSRTQSPSSDNSDLQSRSLPKDTEPIQVLEVIDDVIAPEKSMLTVPGLSSNLAGKKDISEKQSRGIEHSEGHDGDEDDKSSSQASSIPEEIASAYEDEDISEHASSKGEPEGLIFGDINEGGKSDTEVKVNVNADYSDTFAPTSGGESKVIEPAVDEDSGGKEKSERSESSSSEKLSDVNKVETEQTTEPKGEEPQEEQQYSEDFEVDDESISEDIPESLELDEEVQGEDQKEDTFKVFDGEGVLPQETAQEDEPSAKGMLDDITEKIYREIMDDSFECMKSTKTMKSKRTGKKEELGDLQKASASNQSAGETVSSRRETAVTDNITKDLLAEAILQMMTIKQRKCKTKEQATPDTRQPKSPGKQNDSETFPKPSYTATTSSNKSPEYETSTSFIDVGPGFGIHDEQRTISNALMIAKDNQALDDDALKEMDADIEGLLGPSLDDEDEDFPVNENQITDIPSDETEQSIPEYSPMFAVPHNLSEMTSIVNCTLDVLLKRKGEGMPLTNCEPPAQLLGEDNENELESRSMRSYRKLIFDLTKEVLIDTVSQEELVTRPPWAKVKWKGGHKLSRNFKRWKSDDEVRAVVLERVTNLIGLGAPRTTMQTLQRKTPVRGNKKDNVDAILIEELREEEPQWTDYDDDETTVKFQVADSILNMLLDDTVRVFKAIEAKKNARANALIV